MKIHDISLNISSQLVVWPGDEPVRLERVSRIEDGDESNVSVLCMSVHAGTHIDAPAHFLTHGATIEQLPLEILLGPALVVQVPIDISRITAESLEKIGIDTGWRRILFRTRNSEPLSGANPSFREDYVALDASAAQYLVERGVRLIGIDYLSASAFDATAPTHQICLQAGVILLEGLDLTMIHPGEYELICLPIKLEGSDGAPARAVLVER